MNFSYTATGTFQIGNCADVSKTIFVYYKFGEGSTVFSIPKAKKGILEKIVIKRVTLINNKKTYMKTVPLYVDTFNALWNEWELCSETDALAIARDALDQQMALAERTAINCGKD